MDQRHISNRALAPWAAAIAVALVAVAYGAIWRLFPQVSPGAVANDLLFLEDGARRLAAGLAPHADFHLPTGVQPYLGYLWASRLWPGLPPLMGAQLVGFLLLAPLLAAAMARAPGRAMALALLALTALVTLAPVDLFMSDFYGISFHASYNRLASGLALVWFALVFGRGERSMVVDGGLMAYALLLGFFLKIVTLGVVLAPVLALAAFRAEWRKIAALGLALAAAALAALEATTGIVSAYVGDIRAMSAVNSGRAAYFFASFIFKTLFAQVLLGLLIVASLWGRFSEARSRKLTPWATLASLATPLAVAAGALALDLQESQATGGLGFVAAAGLLFAPGLIGAPLRGAKLAAASALVTLTAGALAVLAFQIGAASALNRLGPPIVVDMVQRYLPGATVAESLLRPQEAQAALWGLEGEAGDTVRRIAADGVRLSDHTLYLAQWRTVDEALKRLPEGEAASFGRVMTLSGVDLFGLALDARPAVGTWIVHDVGRTIAPLDPEQARAYLAGADTVFEPTCLIVQAPGAEPMTPWFAAALSAEFEARPLTPCWTLHRRVRP